VAVCVFDVLIWDEWFIGEWTSTWIVGYAGPKRKDITRAHKAHQICGLQLKYMNVANFYDIIPMTQRPWPRITIERCTGRWANHTGRREHTRSILSNHIGLDHSASRDAGHTEAHTNSLFPSRIRSNRHYTRTRRWSITWSAIQPGYLTWTADPEAE